jgi:hypothetical protein
VEEFFMGKKAFDRKLRYGAVVTATILSLLVQSPGFAQPAGDRNNATATPMKCHHHHHYHARRKLHL